MKSLFEYFNKNVRLTDIDGKQWTGYVETYTPAIDSDENIESIAIMTSKQGLTEFMATEIKTIAVE